MLNIRQEKNLNFGFTGMILAIYIGISPVYWFWKIPVEYIQYFKSVAIISFCISAFFLSLHNKKFLFPRGVFGILGLLLLILSMTSGFFQSDFDDIYKRFFDIILGFIFMWSVYWYVICHGDILRVFVFSNLIIMIFSVLVVMSGVFHFPNWKSPFLAQFLLSDTGFGGLRTGWSLGLSFFLPTSLMISSLLGWNNKMKQSIMLALSLFTILASQLVVGGRSGLFSSVVILLVWILIETRFSILWIIVIFILFFYFVNIDWLFVHLRFDRLHDITSFSDLNQFSANRIYINKEALRLIFEKPFFGYGFSDIGIGFIKSGDVVHNLWLRVALQTGFVGFFVLLCIFFYYLFFSINFLFLSYKSDLVDHKIKVISLAVFLTILNGLIVSMFEPNAILGTFQTSAMWWASVGTLIGLHSNHSYFVK